MAIKQRRPSSISLTFKVVQVINQLRRCLKLRVSSLPTSKSPPGSRACLGLDPSIFRGLAKGLSRISPEGRKQLHHASNRICKKRKNSRPSLKLDTRGQHDNAADPNTSGEEVQHALRSLDLDTNISSPDALSAVCSDDRLFLQGHRLGFEPCSLNGIIQSLMLVHEAISVLCAARSQYDDTFIVAQGNAIGLSIDAVFIANYEHLLLALQSQLIDALTRKVVEALIENDLDKRQRKLLNWFTEFPDNRHPLSTTWPWSIRPSLAVLWGVCWMFYDNENTGGRNPRVRQSKFLQDEQVRGWNVPQASDYYNFGLAQLQPILQQNVNSSDGESLRQFAAAPYPASHSHLSGGGKRDHMSRAAAQPLCFRTSSSGSFGSASRFDSLSGPVGHGPTRPHPTYYSQAIPSPIQANNNNFCVPRNSGIATNTVFAFPLQQLDVNDVNTWHEFTQHNLPPQASTSHLTNPTIRVTEDSVDLDGDAFAAPQTDFTSFDIYSHGAQQPQAPLLNINTNLSNLVPSSFNMGNCPPPDTSPIHTTHIVRHERNSSINSNSNIPTPVSMADSRSPLLSPVDNLRRHSVTSPRGHLRQQSEDNSSQDDDDAGLSPKKNYSYKRVEEPPRNADGKMVCKYQECSNITFDRKCEWSKHMDKHDRPYKCNVKGCEKLQGFTYSGGLLRHEREVHKMHGGTKKSLFCRFPDCKRSSGSGFTRKENLAEHIRRVHRRTSMSSDLGHMVIPRSEDEATDVRLASESPYQRPAELIEDAHIAKRKRMSEAGISEEGEGTDMRAEIKRLRRENEEKDVRLRQLEQAVMALQQNHR